MFWIIVREMFFGASENHNVYYKKKEMLNLPER